MARTKGSVAFGPVSSSFGPLVPPEWLRDNLGEPGLAVVDCRFVLGEPGAGEQLQAAARRAGVGAGVRVIAYDEASEGGAARLWWLLGGS
jgi:3-mercaptopyruvate sulfurtransferase SseA